MKKIAKAVLYDGYRGGIANVEIYFLDDGSLWFAHTSGSYRWPVNHETYYFESDAREFVENVLSDQSNVKMVWSV